jgi:hypothetical protein
MQFKCCKINQKRSGLPAFRVKEAL